MDLIKELKLAVKNPFNFKNLYIIFFHLFLILIVGLSMLIVIKIVFLNKDTLTACSTPKSNNFTETVINSKNIVYQIKFSGNEKCFLHSWFTWENEAQNLSLWVYDPNGNVTVVEKTASLPNLYYFSNSPLTKGTWRLILKTDSAKALPFSGSLEIR